jgi:tungstate transport system substrate-binding protein
MREILPNLVVIVGGDSIDTNQDPSLLNPYGVIPVDPAKNEVINGPLAEEFATWITSPEVQEMIGEFGVDTFGQPLFYPNAN